MIYYIKANDKRKSEVIAALVSMGGANLYNFSGGNECDITTFYYIDTLKSADICYVRDLSELEGPKIELFLEPVKEENTKYFIKGVAGASDEVKAMLVNHGAIICDIQSVFADETKIYYISHQNKICTTSVDNVDILYNMGYKELFLEHQFEPGDYITYRPCENIESNLVCGIFKDYNRETGILTCFCSLYRTNNELCIDNEIAIKMNEISCANKDEREKLDCVLKSRSLTFDRNKNELVCEFTSGEMVITMMNDSRWSVNFFSYLDKHGFAKCLVDYNKNKMVYPFKDEFKYLLGKSEQELLNIQTIVFKNGEPVDLTAQIVFKD